MAFKKSRMALSFGVSAAGLMNEQRKGRKAARKEIAEFEKAGFDRVVYPMLKFLDAINEIPSKDKKAMNLPEVSVASIDSVEQRPYFTIDDSFGTVAAWEGGSIELGSQEQYDESAPTLHFVGMAFADGDFMCIRSRLVGSIPKGKRSAALQWAEEINQAYSREIGQRVQVIMVAKDERGRGQVHIDWIQGTPITGDMETLSNAMTESLGNILGGELTPLAEGAYAAVGKGELFPSD